jgi:hypothetical protein
MKTLFRYALLLLAFHVPASAQDADTTTYRPFELAWNPISYLRQDGQNLKGGSFSLAWRRSERRGYVLDLSIHQTPGINPVVHTAYRFGPRFFLPARGKFTPFVQVLGGGAYVGTKIIVNGTTTTSIPGASGLSFAAGGGLNMQLKPWFSWRVFQADYSLIRARGDTLNGVRLHTGGVFHFGQDR